MVEEIVRPTIPPIDLPCTFIWYHNICRSTVFDSTVFHESGNPAEAYNIIISMAHKSCDIVDVWFSDCWTFSQSADQTTSCKISVKISTISDFNRRCVIIMLIDDIDGSISIDSQCLRRLNPLWIFVTIQPLSFLQTDLLRPNGLR